jgi:hypothetical protein
LIRRRGTYWQMVSSKSLFVGAFLPLQN